MKLLQGYGIVKSIAGLSCLVAILVAFGANLSQGSAPLKRKVFEIQYPDLSNLASGKCRADDPDPCAQEAAALADALIVLEAAQAAAQQAYLDWIACTEGPGPNPQPDPDPLPPTGASILESD